MIDHDPIILLASADAHDRRHALELAIAGAAVANPAAAVPVLTSDVFAPGDFDDELCRFVASAAISVGEPKAEKIVRLAALALRQNKEPFQPAALARIALSYCSACVGKDIACSIAATELPRLAQQLRDCIEHLSNASRGLRITHAALAAASGVAT